MSLKNYDFATIMNAPYLEVNHPPSKKKQTEFRSTYDTPFMTQINLFSLEFNNLPKRVYLCFQQTRLVWQHALENH